eukprot:GGOE01042591.1.p1 GENE.GGOE01042591.1~~GGOE01042591.1.p1  ORF type:complete len:312 (-),score=40.81 GGOE01042591.1:129-1019(-)
MDDANHFLLMRTSEGVYCGTSCLAKPKPKPRPICAAVACSFVGLFVLVMALVHQRWLPPNVHTTLANRILPCFHIVHMVQQPHTLKSAVYAVPADRSALPELASQVAIAQIWERELRRFNENTNIYSREAYDKLPFHIEDSWRLGDRVHGGSVLDLGSGSGLPAVFVAASNQPEDVYAVESKLRKAQFLKEVKAELGLDNLHVITASVQELCRRWSFDVPYVTAKAFKRLKEVVEVAERCVAGPSTLLVPISAGQRAEAAALGGQVEEEGGFLYFHRRLNPSVRRRLPKYQGQEDG